MNWIVLKRIVNISKFINFLESKKSERIKKFKRFKIKKSDKKNNFCKNKKAGWDLLKLTHSDKPRTTKDLVQIDNKFWVTYLKKKSLKFEGLKNQELVWWFVRD